MALHDNLLNQQGGGNDPGGAVDTVNNQHSGSLLMRLNSITVRWMHFLENNRHYSVIMENARN
jgi:hypothetical protein